MKTLVYWQCKLLAFDQRVIFCHRDTLQGSNCHFYFINGAIKTSLRHHYIDLMHWYRGVSASYKPTNKTIQFARKYCCFLWCVSKVSKVRGRGRNKDFHSNRIFSKPREGRRAPMIRVEWIEKKLLNFKPLRPQVPSFLHAFHMECKSLKRQTSINTI